VIHQALLPPLKIKAQAQQAKGMVEEIEAMKAAEEWGRREAKKAAAKAHRTVLAALGNLAALFILIIMPLAGLNRSICNMGCQQKKISVR
jgi:hypothetical protein